MKKKFIIFIFLLFGFFALSQENDTLQLPKPKTEGGMPLMEALKNRQTQRDFSKKELSKQELSNLLWAANGINRPESGKRTAPSAVNWQDIDIYVALKNGAYLYNAQDNTLVQIHSDDVRKDMGKQGFTDKAPVCLAYVSNYKRMKLPVKKVKNFYSATNTGFISQNVYLYCASEGLATVVLGYINKKKIIQALKLEDFQKVILTQCVGYPKAEFETSDDK